MSAPSGLAAKLRLTLNNGARYPTGVTSVPIWLIKFAVLTCTIAFSAPAAGAESPLPDEGAGEIWSVFLNILKVIGLLTTTTAGLISIITQTKTTDGHLTRSGRSLLFLGVFGGVLALSSQGVEWVKVASEQRATRLRNATVLREIQRAVTRFEHFYLKFTLVPPRDESAFVNYISTVRPEIDEFIDADPAILEEIDGMRVVMRSNDGVGIFRASSDSPIFPNEKEHGLVGTYVKHITPRLALFKKPIDAREYLDRNVKPDLLLFPSGSNIGNLSALFVVDEDKKPLFAELDHAMGLSINVSSGQITSTKDLEGSQAILCLSGRVRRNDALKDMMSKTRASSIALVVNYEDYQAPNDAKMVASDFCPLAYTWTIPGTR